MENGGVTVADTVSANKDMFVALSMNCELPESSGSRKEYFTLLSRIVRSSNP